MRVIRTAAAGIALCSDAENARHEIAVDLVEPVAAGDGILVHAGVAIGRVEVVS